MSDYDAIVIGAGHNGLTAAAVMARGGMRVLCLEKNQFTGGMASTTELIRGYRFELAGSVQFPVPERDLRRPGLRRVPDLRARRALGEHRRGRPGPDDLPHRSRPARGAPLATTSASTPCSGLAEIMNWAQAPGRALGRFEVRTPPKTLDEMFACATDETEREAIRTAMFGTVMDVIDRYLPDPVRHAQMRALLAFLSVNSTFRGPVHARERAVHGVRARRRRATTRRCRRSAAASVPCPITSARCSRTAVASCAGTPAWPASSSPTAACGGVELADGDTITRPRRGVEPRRHPHVHRADRSASSCPSRSPGASMRSTTVPRTSRCTSPSASSPS